MKKKRWNSQEEKAARDELKRREEKVKVIGQMNGTSGLNGEQRKQDMMGQGGGEGAKDIL